MEEVQHSFWSLLQRGRRRRRPPHQRPRGEADPRRRWRSRPQLPRRQGPRSRWSWPWPRGEEARPIGGGAGQGARFLQAGSLKRVQRRKNKARMRGTVHKRLEGSREHCLFCKERKEAPFFVCASIEALPNQKEETPKATTQRTMKLILQNYGANEDKIGTIISWKHHYDCKIEEQKGLMGLITESVLYVQGSLMARADTCKAGEADQKKKRTQELFHRLE